MRNSIIRRELAWIDAQRLAAQWNAEDAASGIQYRILYVTGEGHAIQRYRPFRREVAHV